MTRRRWIADEVSGNQASLHGENARHLARVLRARVGQQFEISTPQGVRLGTVTQVEPDRVNFSLEELPQAEKASQRREVNLYLAIFKFDRFEWAIEKCTELGVTSVIPVLAQRTDSHLAGAASKRVERWRKIAHEAAQQSRRDIVPEIMNPKKLHAAVLEAAGKKIVLAETERRRQFVDLVQAEPSVSLAVGPEGGWTDSELTLFANSGWLAASLGPNILRAETAAIVATALALQ
ncbi:MAG: 16S rRNA (uracil(1498)-N(3))-methyltransferase [Acidobacteria bacterium]|nr:16S rRNA (uracil(1498)-N(3))-methyltransferase [Acidobacteriota bacterium]